MRDLHAASLTTSSQVVVSFPLRLSELCVMTKEVIDSGVIGTVENVQAVNNVPFYGSNYYHGWMRNEALTGGLWLQKATHDLDYLTYLMGRTPARMVAVESKTVFTGDMPAGLVLPGMPDPEGVPGEPVQPLLHAGHPARHERGGRVLGRPLAVQLRDRHRQPRRGDGDPPIRVGRAPHLYPEVLRAAGRGKARGDLHRVQGDGQLRLVLPTRWWSITITTAGWSGTGWKSEARGHHGGDERLAHDFLEILNGTGPSRDDAGGWHAQRPAVPDGEAEL